MLSSSISWPQAAVIFGRKCVTLLIELVEVYRRIEAYREAIRHSEPTGKLGSSLLPGIIYVRVQPLLDGAGEIQVGLE